MTKHRTIVPMPQTRYYLSSSPRVRDILCFSEGAEYVDSANRANVRTLRDLGGNGSVVITHYAMKKDKSTTQVYLTERKVKNISSLSGVLGRLSKLRGEYT